MDARDGLLRILSVHFVFRLAILFRNGEDAQALDGFERVGGLGMEHVNEIRRSLGIVLGLALLCVAGTLRSEENKNLDARRQVLKKLVAEQWEYTMRENPEFATIIGDYRYNDRWSDISLAHVEQNKKDVQEWLARFEAIDTTGFPEQEKLNQQLMVRNLKAQIEGMDLKLYEMPVDRFREHLLVKIGSQLLAERSLWRACRLRESLPRHVSMPLCGD